MKIEPQAVEEMPGLRVERITSLSAYAAKIRALRYNALDTTQNRAGFDEKRGAVSEIKHSLRAPGDHDAIYVAEDGEKLLGFLAVEKSTVSGKRATIRQLWTARPGRSQYLIMAKLIGAAKQDLTDNGYTKLNAMRLSPSSHFSVMQEAQSRYLRMTDPDNASAEPVDIDIDESELLIEMPGAANDTMAIPEAANDDEHPLDAAA